MTEKHIQHELVIWFSQTYPQHRGLLFLVNNNTYSAKHGMSQRALGMIAGVSDLIFIVPKIGTLVGIELKAEGSEHKKHKIENQLEWGWNVIKNNGMYIMSCNLNTIKQFIIYLIDEKYPEAEAIQTLALMEVAERFKESGTKVKF